MSRLMFTKKTYDVLGKTATQFCSDEHKKFNYQQNNPLQAGVQIGNACWELYCLEHGIDKDGNMPTDAVS